MSNIRAQWAVQKQKHLILVAQKHAEHQDATYFRKKLFW